MSTDTSILQSPEPVPFDDRASERDETGFMSSQPCRTGFGPLGLKCTDDGLRLVLQSRGIPIWFVVVCLLIPASGFVAFFAKDFFWGRRFEPVIALALVMIPFIVADFVGFFKHLNRRAGAGKVRLVFDRATGTVELPDFGLVIPTKKIRQVILVQGYQTKKDQQDTNTFWTTELSLVAEGDWPGLHRIHVISSGNKRLCQIAQTLATAMHVPLSSCRGTLSV